MTPTEKIEMELCYGGFDESFYPIPCSVLNFYVFDCCLNGLFPSLLQEFKIKLKNMKKILKESEGHVDLDLVDSIVSILDRANIFVEISKQRLEAVLQRRSLKILEERSVKRLL